jgi:hypothetical protein
MGKASMKERKPIWREYLMEKMTSINIYTYHRKWIVQSYSSSSGCGDLSKEEGKGVFRKRLKI